MDKHKPVKFLIRNIAMRDSNKIARDCLGISYIKTWDYFSRGSPQDRMAVVLIDHIRLRNSPWGLGPI